MIRRGRQHDHPCRRRRDRSRGAVPRRRLSARARGARRGRRCLLAQPETPSGVRRRARPASVHHGRRADRSRGRRVRLHAAVRPRAGRRAGARGSAGTSSSRSRSAGPTGSGRALLPRRPLAEAAAAGAGARGLRPRDGCGPPRACAGLLRGELGLLAGRFRRSGRSSVKSGGQILWMLGEESPQRLARPELRHLGRGRRRLARRQGLSSAHRRALPEAGGGPCERRPPDPAGHASAPDPRAHPRAPATATRGSCAPTTSTSRTTSRCTSSSRTARVADVFSAEVVLGGISSWLEVRREQPPDEVQPQPDRTRSTTYNPREELLDDVYVVEKIGPSRAGAIRRPTRTG